MNRNHYLREQMDLVLELICYHDDELEMVRAHLDAMDAGVLKYHYHLDSPGEYYTDDDLYMAIFLAGLANMGDGADPEPHRFWWEWLDNQSEEFKTEFEIYGQAVRRAEYEKTQPPLFDLDARGNLV